jgi:hypothetical protein
MKHALFALLFLTVACAPSGETRRASEGTGPVMLEGTTGYSELKAMENRRVVVRGKISAVPWQHMVGASAEFPHAEYFDLEGGFQIMIYAREPISCAGTLEVTGTVVAISGPGKRPSPDEPIHTEYHIQVDTWKCE